MSGEIVDIEYTFHDVGEGLFTSGALGLDGTPKTLTWVYDCGTHSKKAAKLGPEIGRLVAKLGGGIPTLDFVALSHFDEDHINGFLDLAKVCNVKWLLLSYLEPWQRALLAARCTPGSAARLFVLDPVPFVAGLRYGDGVGVEHILFVPESRRSAAPGGRIEGSEVVADGVLTIPTDVDLTGVAGSDLAGWQNDLGSGRVAFAKLGAALQIWELWEFLPYNDPSLLPQVSDDFVNEAETLRGDVLQKKGMAQEKAWCYLKCLYKTCFAGGEERNLASLFLYGGPTRSTSSASLLARPTRGKVSPGQGVWRGHTRRHAMQWRRVPQHNGCPQSLGQGRSLGRPGSLSAARQKGANSGLSGHAPWSQTELEKGSCREDRFHMERVQ